MVGEPHMAEFPVSTSRVSWLIQVDPTVLLYQEVGTMEYRVLLLRSSRTRDVRYCHSEGKDPLRWFLLRSTTLRAPRELQAGGSVLERL